VSLFSGGRVRPMTGIRREATNVPRFGGRFGDRTSQRLQQLADRTSGLNLVGVENVVLQVDPPDPEPITLEFLKELKRDILSDESGGLLEVTEPDAGIDRSEAFNHVGGLDPVCTKLLEISRMMDEASNSETVRRSLPNGLLFLGPPGTGKTLVARAFANACGVNFAEFGNIRSMWVGESERNLSRALELIRSLKPVVVFLDEIDQSMGQRGSASDSGVDQRLFARILQFMSDPELEGEVIWIGASNEPAKIDAALKRSGRFDLRIPFLRPPEEARKDILRLQFQQRGASIDFDADQWKQVLTATDGYTGAELESIAKEAIWNHLVADGDTQNVVIPFAAMESALESFQPPVDRSEYHRMEQAALREVTAVDMLPDEYRKQRMELIEGSDE
jgi:transitional endoplasmic reticulum ATPase